MRSFNEGRGRSPGNTGRRSSRPSPARSTFNEGRGRSPGNTRRMPRAALADSHVQRRPGPKPRQHAPPRVRGPPVSPTFNEGRGRSPGNTRPELDHLEVALARSTKAGAEAPATPRASLAGFLQRQLRSTWFPSTSSCTSQHGDDQKPPARRWSAMRRGVAGAAAGAEPGVRLRSDVVESECAGAIRDDDH